MMKPSDIAWIPLAAATAALPLQHAQASDHGDWYVAPALNYVIADDDRNADDDVGLQIGLGRQLGAAWNLEAALEADTLDIDGGGKFKQRGLALDGLYFFDRAPAFAKQQDLPTDLQALAVHPKFIASVQEHLDRINTNLARYETIKRFALLPNDFTIERDEMTPTQKLKRRVILQRYAADIEAMYPPDDPSDR